MTRIFRAPLPPTQHEMLSHMPRTLSAAIIGLVLLAGLPAQNQVLQLQNTGTSGWFDVANVTGLAPANITVEAWFTYDETTVTAPPSWAFPTILRKNLAANSEEYMLRVQAGNNGNRSLLWLVRTPNGVVRASYNFAPGEFLNWTHVAGTWDGTTIRLFLNGSEVATGLGTGNLVDNGGALKVGAGDTAPGSAAEIWNGGLDHVRIWSVARTSAQIMSTMFTPLGAAPGLEAEWLLEGDAFDVTGNLHDGVLAAPATFVTATLPTPSFQVNSAEANFDLNGNQGSVFAPAITTAMVGEQVNVNLSTSVPATLYDLALTAPAGLVPSNAGGFLTPGGQHVNMDLTDPSLTMVFGGSFATPFVPYPGPLTLPLVMPAPAALSSQMIVLDATAVDGFRLSAGATLNAIPCPSSWNFDALASIGQGQFPLGLVDGGGALAWTTHTGGTTSTGTGPTSAFSPSNYIYCETSGSGGTAQFIFDTCPVDVTALSNFTLDFALSRIGASIGTLNIYQDDGSGTFATLIATYTGADPAQAQGGTEWSNESIPVIPSSGFIAFRFEYTAGGTFTGDIAIDDLQVR